MSQHTLVFRLMVCMVLVLLLPLQSFPGAAPPASDTKQEREALLISDVTLRSGEGLSSRFTEGVRSVSRVKKQIASFFTETSLQSDDWVAAFRNINAGRGTGHFFMTYAVVAIFIFIGLAVERLTRRWTDNFRRRILDSASLGRLHFISRVLSHLLLNVFGLGVYMLTTFLLCAFFYEEMDPGYLIVSATLLPTYYIRFFILAAGFLLSPSAPVLRLFPLNDEDAKFLFRWTVALTVTGIAIADVAYIMMFAGLSRDHFLQLYGLSGLGITFLLIVMIWRSRQKVAQAIWPAHGDEDESKFFIRAGISKIWHFFAILYVVFIGIFWFIKALAGQGAILELIVSLFLIPVFIGISHWAEHVLDLSIGVSPSPHPENASTVDGSVGVHDPTASEAEKPANQEEAGIFNIAQHAPRIKRTLRICLAALLFFLILRLWGIDLPVGRVFTSTVLKILVAVILGVAAWQYAKSRIDKKLREEMPEEEMEMEEGGSGGSRLGTLLMLLRKFVLSVLFLIVSLIILSAVGIEIGPLIAGAGVIGLAIGFGSQALVKDILSGVFFLIDDAFRVGDYIETAGIKGMVEKISLRSVKLRHPRGMVFTVPFGDMGSVQNFSRDYIITKLDIRVRYDVDVDKIRKIVKRINNEMQNHEEIGPVLLSKIKSQGIREMDDSAMILRVKFKTIPGEQFVIRREVYRRIQELFRETGIEFAHRNVTVYMPQEEPDKGAAGGTADTSAQAGSVDKKRIEAGAAAAIAASEANGEKPKEPV